MMINKIKLLLPEMTTMQKVLREDPDADHFGVVCCTMFILFILG